jgi:hypothetical protein
MNTIRNITTLQWIGIVILFNTTLLGGASQLADLALSAVAVKAILAAATLGNGFLGGLVTMFGGLSSQLANVAAMPGIEHMSVNAKAGATLATAAVSNDPALAKIEPLPSAEAAVTKTAEEASK